MFFREQFFKNLKLPCKVARNKRLFLKAVLRVLGVGWGGLK
jgi:hypothetical protein